jgi:hypothetical protein
MHLQYLHLLSMHHGVSPACLSGVSSILSSAENEEQRGYGGNKLIASGSSQVSVLGYYDGRRNGRLWWIRARVLDAALWKTAAKL